jgi:CheY-like chemotaxis protein
LVAKILVADDNSNIQRMVGLALKDQGIDVVAVGNGEAAVRKIADVRPDLVLADVFMPVRNGYEVCQYVKTNASLAHIPVILLVGAFDPLDEQEAQRVGADGVLKKPFVPPDPLISMVKSALQRAGVAHGDTPVAKAPAHEALRAADLLTPSIASLPTVAAIPVQPAHAHEEPIAAAAEQESFVDEVQVRPEPVRIDSGSQPVAFGSLLETPVVEQEDDQVFVSPANTEFTTDRDWHAADDEEETETEEDQESGETPWRRDEADAEGHAETKSGKGASGKSAKDWRAGGFEQIARVRSRGTGWEPEEEKPELVGTAPAASSRAAETPAAPPIAPQEAAPIPATPFGQDPWAPKASPVLQEQSSTETVAAVEVVSHAASEAAPTVEASVSDSAEASPAPAEPEKIETKSSWFSSSTNPWDAELKKANQLASTWDVPASTSAPAASSNGAEKAAETFSEKTKSMIEEAALPPVALEAIREEAALVTEDATQAAGPAPAEKDFYAHEPVVETEAAKPAAVPNMEELVARVLANMNPEVLQAVTREILKPVVEAMVKEELKSKKP